MKIGPKYKIARRLGAPVFEKTQTAKYQLSLSRKERSTKSRGKSRSEYGKALLEKQKARFTYGISERQFRGYVDKAAKAKIPTQALFALLEGRLDNVLYRAGFAKTRLSARQMASHGHILVNGKRVTVPSILLKVGDVVELRGGSKESQLFRGVAESMKQLTASTFVEVEPDSRTAKVTGVPSYESGEHVFDLGTVIEFYNR